MFDFVGKRKVFFLISIALVVITIISCFAFGVSLDIQFKGGSIVTYSYEGDIDMTVVESTFEKAVNGNISLQQGRNEVTGKNNFTVALSQDQGIGAEVQQAATVALQTAFPEAKIATTAITNVDAVIGREFFEKCMIAVTAAVALMIVYIGFRFKKMNGWAAGVMAAVALCHDILVVFATFVIFRIPINDNFIAVALTILGYSLNATIVIYDRIRENKTLLKSKTPVEELVNVSINQSLGRAFGTSFATILSMVVVAVMGFMYGLDSIVTFAFPLIMGMISGLYSSVCLAGPLWVEWETRKAKKAA